MFTVTVIYLMADTVRIVTEHPDRVLGALRMSTVETIIISNQCGD